MGTWLLIDVRLTQLATRDTDAKFRAQLVSTNFVFLVEGASSPWIVSLDL